MLHLKGILTLRGNALFISSHTIITESTSLHPYFILFVTLGFLFLLVIVLLIFAHFFVDVLHLQLVRVAIDNFRLS